MATSNRFHTGAAVLTSDFEQREALATGEEKKALEQFRFLAERAADGHGLERRYNSVSADGSQHSISVASDPFGGPSTVGIRFTEANAVAGGGRAAADLLTPEGHALLSHAMTVGTNFDPAEVLAAANEKSQLDVRGMFTEQFHGLSEQATVGGQLDADQALGSFRSEVVSAVTSGKGISVDDFQEHLDDAGDRFGFRADITADNRVEIQLSDSLDGPEGPGTVTSISSDGLLTGEGQAVLAAALEADGAPFDPQAVLENHQRTAAPEQSVSPAGPSGMQSGEQSAGAERESQLFANVYTLNQQYGQAWTQSLDELTGGKLAQSASAAQLSSLATIAGNASMSGAYLEDVKSIYADSFNAGIFGSQGQQSVDNLIAGVQDSAVDSRPVNGVGHLPPVAHGQDRDLRSTTATSVGIELGGVGEIGDGGFGSFISQQSPTTDPAPGFGAVDNSALIGQGQSWGETPSASDLIDQGWGQDTPAAADAFDVGDPFASPSAPSHGFGSSAMESAYDPPAGPSLGQSSPDAERSVDLD